MVREIRPRDWYPYHQESNGLTLALKPYFKSADADMIFGADLPQVGMLATEIVLFNDMDESFNLAAMKIRLLDNQDRPFVELAPNEVAEHAKYKVWKRSLSWGLAGTSLFFFTVPFAVTAGVDARKANRQTREALLEAGMVEIWLRPHEAVHWYVFHDIGGPIEFESAPSIDRLMLLEVSGICDLTGSRQANFGVVVERE